MTTESALLDAVFGKESSGATPPLRAQSSQKLFVRSQHQLSQYSDKALGRILSAGEALRLFGWDTLKELADHSATPILEDADEPYRTINDQLDQLGLTLAEAAPKVGWSNDNIRQFEQHKQVPFRALERMAQGIDLNEDQLGVVSGAGADSKLTVRLKKARSDYPQQFTVNTVLGLTEAAWTIRKQYYLSSLIGENALKRISDLGFSSSNDYGSKLSPDYKKGYELARQTRKLLGIPADEPIASLKDLIEVRLCIPVIQLELHRDFAGATVSSESKRGIVVNLNGDNSNPLVRRMTMAHELGHLLWDPDQRLKELRVDRYDEIDIDVVSDTRRDRVERRANAFAVEFLTPSDAILKEFNKAKGGKKGLTIIINRFGVSRTAIARHLANASFNTIGAVDGALPDVSTDDWEVAETLALPLFRPTEVPISRRGRFAYYIYQAFDRKLVSSDSAASLFRCKSEDLSTAIATARDLVAS